MEWSLFDPKNQSLLDQVKKLLSIPDEYVNIARIALENAEAELDKKRRAQSKHMSFLITQSQAYLNLTFHKNNLPHIYEIETTSKFSSENPIEVIAKIYQIQQSKNSRDLLTPIQSTKPNKNPKQKSITENKNMLHPYQNHHFNHCNPTPSSSSDENLFTPVMMTLYSPRITIRESIF